MTRHTRTRTITETYYSCDGYSCGTEHTYWVSRSPVRHYCYACARRRLVDSGEYASVDEIELEDLKEFYGQLRDDEEYLS